MSPAEIATEHAVQRCFVVYIYVFAVVLEELEKLVDDVSTMFETPIEIFKRALDALTASFPDFLT